MRCNIVILVKWRDKREKETHDRGGIDGNSQFVFRHGYDLPCWST